jgi:cytochrome P450
MIVDTAQTIKKLLRPFYRRVFKKTSPGQKQITAPGCPFHQKPPGKEFSGYEQLKAILADDQTFHTSPCYDATDPHHVLLTASGDAHNQMAKRLRDYIAGHKEQLEQQLDNIAAELLRELPRNTPFDFRVTYCDQMAFRAMGAFYGLTSAECEELADYVGILPHNELFKERLEDFMRQLVEREPGSTDGLLAAVRQWCDKGVIDQDQAIFLLTLLWFAGIDTSTIALGRVMEYLLKNPALWTPLTSSPKYQLKFIEEVLRLKPPTVTIQRSVVKDTTLDGQKLVAGERIWLDILQANRDPKKFSTPQGIDLQSNNHKHLAFGYGMHQCIGMSLVRWEAKAMLDQILPQIKSFELMADAETTVYGEPVEVNPITYLQVRYAPPAKNCPFHQEKNIKEITSFSAVEQILQRDEDFRSQPAYKGSDPLFTMLAAEGERHRKHTKMVRQSLNSSRPVFEEELRSYIRQLLAELPVDKAIDFRKQISDKVTVFAVVELFGLSDAETVALEQLETTDRNSPEFIETIRSYLKKWVGTSNRPQEGMIRDLQLEIQHGQLSDEEASYILLLMWRGGLDSLSMMLSRLCEHLLMHIDWLPRLQKDESIRNKFIEESIRISTPTAAIFREAAVDATIGNLSIQKGDWLRLDLSKANRDPDVFSSPDQLNIDAPLKGLISFGKGMHQCIGMTVSRTEMRILLQELLPIVPHLQILDIQSQLYYGEEADIHAVTQLLVKLDHNPLQKPS